MFINDKMRICVMVRANFVTDSWSIFTELESVVIPTHEAKILHKSW